MAWFDHQPTEEFINIAFDDLVKAEKILRAHPEIITMRTTDVGESALQHLAIEAQIEAVKLLIRYGADVNTPDSFGETPLHSIVRLGHQNIVRLLLEHGANPNAGVGIDDTPLHLAASEGKLETIKLLLAYRADINALNDLVETPLFCAVNDGQTEAARLLLSRGAIVEFGDTPLLSGLREESTVELVDLLVTNGADVNRPHPHHCNWSPLHFAVASAPLIAIERLLQHGADPTYVNEDGLSTYDRAREFNRNDVLTMLERYTHKS